MDNPITTFSYDKDTDTVTQTITSTVVTEIPGQNFRNQLDNATAQVTQNQALIDQAKQALGMN